MKDMDKKEHMAVLAHPLCITRIDVIIKFLIKEKGIKAKSIPQILAALGVSLLTAPATLIEYVLYYSRIKKEKIKGPLFILGHWRSGTTLVQYLLAQDKNFGNFDPVFNFAFNFYYTLGWLFRPLTKGSLSERRPQDNMRLSLDLPLEEYMAFAKIEADSLYPVNYFPMSFKKYMNNSYWQDFPRKKADKLEKKYDRMLKKASHYNKHKMLLLKSPDNTGRMTELYRMYPEAKFINIYRNPYTVIRSTMHLYKSVFDLWTLQDLPDEETLEDMVIDNFKRMYESYFKALKVIPEGLVYEIRFEDFEKDPYPYLKEAYEKLDLGDYEKAKPGFEEYMKAEKDYKKNEYDYPERLKQKVDEKLGFFFEHYGYEKGVI
ncbi:MAG: sulfotransferase [Clostridia bacterium]|nr:sulfotransferase [Clostridia bacterium]